MTLRGELTGDLVFLRATVGKTEGRFLLDTGAAVSVLDEAFAAKAAVARVRQEVVQGPAGPGLAWQAGATVLAITGGPSATVLPSLLDLSPVARRMGGTLSGLIGSDLLSAFVLVIDYRSGEVRFLPASGLAAPASAAAMRVGRIPYVPGSVRVGAVTKAAEFQIDTGANLALALYKGFADAAFPNVAAATGAQIGVSGVTRTRIGRIDALTVAGVQLLDLQADFADHLSPDDASRDYAGVIGGPAWRGRRIVLDYPARRFWIA